VVEVMPFLNFVLHKNAGVSFSFLDSGGELGRWILVILTCSIVLGMTFWLKKTTSRLLMVGIGLVIGGAVGNIYDRILFGAITDFIQFYVGDWSFAVFNMADSSIFLGAALLMWDAFFGKDEAELKKKNDNS
jgi:signal peptidase II